jgi:hypothetical protein
MVIRNYGGIQVGNLLIGLPSPISCFHTRCYQYQRKTGIVFDEIRIILYKKSVSSILTIKKLIKQIKQCSFLNMYIDLDLDLILILTLTQAILILELRLRRMFFLKRSRQ